MQFTLDSKRSEPPQPPQPQADKGNEPGLTVFFDGACPLCRREIAHLRSLQPGEPLWFTDVADPAVTLPLPLQAAGLDRAALMRRFHVQLPGGEVLDGAAAFTALWSRLPGWRWLARLARLPGMPWAAERCYRLFLRLRPRLQAAARRLDAAPGAARTLPPQLLADLRSDHAGETGAVCIYAGILAVSRNAALRGFAQRHRATEAEHLRLIDDWLPPHQRSRLLPAWRLAGWLTGALPALAGPRAVHATIAAVETFVDRHYQAQIDHLLAHGGPAGLLPLLQRCQADECHHRDEAQAALARPPGLLLRAWCRVVGAGSAAAVHLARRC